MSKSQGRGTLCVGVEQSKCCQVPRKTGQRTTMIADPSGCNLSVRGQSLLYGLRALLTLFQANGSELEGAARG